MTVADLLSQKGRQVYTIDHEANCLEAANRMIEYNVGSLVVVDDAGKPVGIISERDLVRKVAAKGLELSKAAVRDFMTREVIVVTPDDTLDAVMEILTRNRIRHVPVIEEGRLAGLVSIGDVVKAQLHHVAVQNRYLMDYIEGKYPG